MESLSLLDFVEEGARKVVDTMTSPDADWAPMLFALAPTEQQDTGRDLGVVIIPLLMEDKEASLKDVSWALAEVKAVEAVMLSSSWLAKYDSPEKAAQAWLPPSMTEGRQEFVVLTHVTLDGHLLRMMPIERHKDAPPTLGETVECDQIDGRFLKALSDGIGKPRPVGPPSLFVVRDQDTLDQEDDECARKSKS